MNKKLLALGLAIFMIASIFTSCKKGEEDPALSLSSRKARLTGTWKLTSANFTEKGQNYTNVYTFDGTILTVNYNYSGWTGTDNSSYSLTMTINKDNTFEIEEIDDGDRTVTEGYWFFAPANKDEDIKNKERVIFQTTKYTDDDGDVTTYDGSTNSQVEVIDLKRLANKEIIIEIDYKRTSGSVYSITGTKTFTQE